MSEEDIPSVQNIDQPDVKELLNKFKNRHEMNVVDVSEVIYKLITTLKLDKVSGRPKELGTISGWHLGHILGIGKGVVSQYISVWNMSQESKNFLKQYNLSLINAYQVSRIRGKDEAEKVKLQKEMVMEKNKNPSIGITGKRTDILQHAINQAEMVLNGVMVSFKVPKEIFSTEIPLDETHKGKIYISNIEKCVNYLCPKLSKLLYLRKEAEFCALMIQNNQTKFCGQDITIDMLNKQIAYISLEIQVIEGEQKLPHISSLLMMKANLEKNI